MLPKIHRLTTYEVEQVQRYGKVVRTEYFLIRYYTAVNGPKIRSINKFAACVPKKIEVGSVGRNALHRAIYAAVPRTLLLVERGMPYFCVITPLHSYYRLKNDRAFAGLSQKLTELFVPQPAL